ncbi:hypothetical protein ACIBSV_50015 [Embleya sp. NPDC050154]|uniref:hypothetical protein n=1 Tax=Embleya sp. NPDC050154 TaxID=3363988 RepID=UPI0037A28DFC
MQRVHDVLRGTVPPFPRWPPGRGLVSHTAGGLFGETAKKTVGVNPYTDIIGVASKAFNDVERYALTHDTDDQPQMHQELHDNR